MFFLWINYIKEKEIGIFNILRGVVGVETHWGIAGTTTRKIGASVYTNTAS
jgi:hypothetical protein